ncbi:MAG: hypothetical protein BWX64_02757 [Acidobacteria bacterium ADurb.Bin051]|nr:MAG: hypothetical protein BWX64_02757 [Acidobacteria bacterium ADurb.Bin051]
MENQEAYSNLFGRSRRPRPGGCRDRGGRGWPRPGSVRVLIGDGLFVQVRSVSRAGGVRLLECARRAVSGRFALGAGAAGHGGGGGQLPRREGAAARGAAAGGARAAGCARGGAPLGDQLDPVLQRAGGGPARCAAAADVAARAAAGASHRPPLARHRLRGGLRLSPPAAARMAHARAGSARLLPHERHPLAARRDRRRRAPRRVRGSRLLAPAGRHLREHPGVHRARALADAGARRGPVLRTDGARPRRRAGAPAAGRAAAPRA